MDTGSGLASDAVPLDLFLRRDEIRSAREWSQKILVSDQVAHDHGLCTCAGPVCTYQPPPPPPRPPLRLRALYWLHRRWWAIKRLPGYRLVHKDDLPDDY